MTCRTFVVACAVLLSAISLSAQTGAAKADPITGTWTGELVPKDGPPPASVKFELKFDGKKQVTGSFTGLQDPGEVKNGTFDPETGALKLELGKLDGPGILIVLEGKVADGTVSGELSGQGRTGTFKLTRKE
ncbi:MAG TPA: hypothetical protein VFJ02_09870 [Vicinamibacterales bacterium]|nr:hypothetical protein [Vicinamibacterales bacterium]